jgi:hypothetical protein
VVSSLLSISQPEETSSMATAGPERPEKKDAKPDWLMPGGSKGFMAFLKTDAAKQIVDQKFIDRLVGANEEIETLNRLMRLVRERFPDHFATDPRKATTKPYNKDVMARLWAAYLEYREAT